MTEEQMAKQIVFYTKILEGANQNNMAQTSVEWFYQRILAKDIQEVFEQAKAMEKEQIMKAVDRGFDEGCKFPEDISLNNAEQYYNEIYESKNNS